MSSRLLFSAASRRLLRRCPTSTLLPPHPSTLLLRHYLSTSARRPTKPSISDRARQLQTRRLWGYAASFSCIAGFITIVLYQFQDQLVFYVTPTDALQKYRSNPTKSRYRLGGLVLENSVVQSTTSPEIQFVITDLITDILVRYQGSLPDLFREGHSVVVEGFIRPTEENPENGNNNSVSGGVGAVTEDKMGIMEKARNLECYFKASEVLAKHDEKYMPAEVAAALEKNKKLLSGEDENKRGDDELVAK